MEDEGVMRTPVGLGGKEVEGTRRDSASQWGLRRGREVGGGCWEISIGYREKRGGLSHVTGGVGNLRCDVRPLPFL
ncbi:hypothetical protein E2C01_043891 [Portunus trituberculatus]|uniref:Uncharacterized protein n=1 Tax=Portunus trituberculatus TaxID=210409 RepID=A0A5B7FXY8_PORTR|nr:hypothetical protein [Portunus trituberculatus]